MPPAIALLVYLMLLVGLIRLDSRTNSKPSPALWVPVVWTFFMGSRLPSQWLGLNQVSMEEAFAEGSPLDRAFFIVLMAVAFGVLTRRRFNWAEFIGRNLALTSFILFALFSVTWSDFPLVTFKRWFRDLGMYLMILVVIADPQPLESISALIRRVSYLLVLLSVALIKYYPQISITYNVWSGAPEYAGATTSKNMLGTVCLISGLFFFWDTLKRWPERRMPKVKYTLFVNIALIAMTLWLLQLSQSATSTACLAIGCVVVVLMRGNWVRTSPRLASAFIPVALALGVVLEFLFALSVHISALLGRDPTLTGRTGIWEVLLSVEINPVVGVGYQSFWLGDRLVTVWRALNAMGLNEAHNGYLETYLNLGIIGLAIMGVVLISSYRRIVRTLPTSPHLATLGLALWSVVIVYNVAEAALGPSLLWFVFLLCVVAGHRAPLKTIEAYTPALTQRRRFAPHRASNVPAAYGSQSVGTPEVRVNAGIRGPGVARIRRLPS